MRHLLLIIAVAAVLLVACGGGKAATPQDACRGLDGLTDVQRAERGCYISGRPTPDVKKTAMAQAEKLYELMDVGLCNSFNKGTPPASGPCSTGELAALRPSRVLEHYAHIIHDTELEVQASALYQQTKAAYETAYALPPVIIVSPGGPAGPGLPAASTSRHLRTRQAEAKGQ